MADSEDDITNCPVCFEEYTESGEHIPRILPCYHTVCERCIGELLRDDSLNCPECRETHPASNGVKIFRQNRYILTHIRKKPGETVHKSETLFSKLDLATKDLNFHREKILAAKEEFGKENAIIVGKITARRELVMRVVGRRFDKLLQEAANQITEVNKSIDEEVAGVDENLAIIDSIRLSTDATTPDEEISNRLGTVKVIVKQVKVNLAKERKYKNLEYAESQATVKDVKKLSGDLVEKEMSVRFTESETVIEDLKAAQREREKEDGLSEAGSVSEYSQSLTRKRSQSQFICQVNQSIGTEYSHILCMSQVAENRLVICGDENGQYRMTLYDLREEDLCSTTLKEEPGGISKIVLGGKQCIAVSYPTKLEIAFYDASNLINVLCRYPVQPQQPSVLCTASSTMLLYFDKIRHTVCWLDCRSLCSSQVPGARITPLQHNWIRDMCCVEIGRKKLVVTTHFSTTFDKTVRSGIRAYNTTINELEWSVVGKVPGMQENMSSWGLATDGRDHLFVSDISNMCIQVFSTDGVYIGAILRQGEQGLGEPWNVCWSSSISSLIVSHTNSPHSDSQNDINIINVRKVDRDTSVRSSGSKSTPTRGRGRGRALPRRTEAF